MKFIGDVHGMFSQYLSIVEHDPEESIQLGDFGIGFRRGGQYSKCTRMTHPEATQYTDCRPPLHHKFIRGNHDNPDKCREHPNYMGEFGIHKDEIFFVSGSWSIDRAWRTPGVDWWEQEELNYEELQRAIDLFKTSFPRIVISHDCPFEINKVMYPHDPTPTRTSLAFDAMLCEWRPPLWVFAHYHTRKDFVHYGTRFVCLDELQVMRLEDETSKVDLDSVQPPNNSTSASDEEGA